MYLLPNTGRFYLDEYAIFVETARHLRFPLSYANIVRNFTISSEHRSMNAVTSTGVCSIVEQI